LKKVFEYEELLQNFRGCFDGVYSFGVYGKNDRLKDNINDSHHRNNCPGGTTSTIGTATPGGTTGGSTTVGGIVCDGIDNGTGATRCYYKNIPTIQVMGASSSAITNGTPSGLQLV